MIPASFEKLAQNGARNEMFANMFSGARHACATHICIAGLAVFAQMTALAQAPAPPPDVDQALNARVTEFFQDFVDGKFRQAMDLVAKDTQDEFFAQGKEKLLGFKIRDVKYNDDFTKATVDLDVKRIWRIQGAEQVVDVPTPTTWEIEDGKWVWYHHVQKNEWVTAMGPSNTDLIKRNPDGTISNIPQKLDQATVAAAAQRIFEASGLDKKEVTLSSDKPSSDKVVFRNGAPGSVSLELYGVPKLPGFSAKLDKATVNFRESAVLEVSYDPADNDGKKPLGAIALNIVVLPFNQTFPVTVKFAPPAN